ncbi:TolB family protein [Schinkia sp. CFF1]
MDDKIENNLHELKEQIYVNEELKQELRKDFLPKNRKSWWRNPWLNGLLAAVIFLGFYLTNSKVDYVSASSLKIANAISFFDVGSGEIVAYTHQTGTLYVSLKGKGIYKYTDKGLTKIADMVAGSFSQSSIEDQLLFSQNGGIYRLSLTPKKVEEITKGKYSQPTWKDSKHIYATKNDGAHSKIVEINLTNMEESIVTDGLNPVFVDEEKQLVFERDHKIVMKNLKNGKETIVDDGTNPALSPDDSYISYIKNEDGIDDVWIKDVNLETSKKITNNISKRIENTKKGLYHYTSPIWNTTENSLYVLKQRQEDPKQSISIMKIVLSEKALTARETVERYLQALIVRDDDYAKSMMEEPPEFLTYSNPHQVGYTIVNSKEGNGGITVSANVYWTYTANPYYQVASYQFELKKENDRFVIQKVTEANKIEITSLDSKNLDLLKNGEKQERLFSLTDIPKEFIKTNSIRISSLALSHDEKEIIFSLQEMREGKGAASGITILKYNREQKTFTEIARLEPKGNDQSLVIEQMSLDSTGQYVIADVFSEPGFVSDTYLFDIEKGTKIEQFNGSHALFWQNKKLMLQVMDENQWMLYEYNPEITKKILF